MNQHPKAKAAGIMPGKFTVDLQNMDIACHCPDTLFGVVTGKVHYEIAADALNTMNQYGLTPPEMVEIIRELREALKELCSADPYDVMGVEIRQDNHRDLLTKTEDFQ